MDYWSIYGGILVKKHLTEVFFYFLKMNSVVSYLNVGYNQNK
jgi:hypothetical protein